MAPGVGIIGVSSPDVKATEDEPLPPCDALDIFM